MSAAPPAKKFNVVLTGALRSGFDAEQVKSSFAKLAKIDIKQAASLLGGGPRVVKSNVDQGTATQFQARFEAIGLQCAVRPVAPAPDSSLDSAGTPTAPAALTTTTLRAAFTGDIALPDDAPANAKLNVAIAVLTALVPVAYVALVMILGGITISHWLYDWTWVADGPAISMLLAYVGVGLAGLIAVGVLLKPLIAPAGRTGWPVRLNKQEDALFFAFVEHLAQRMDAQPPVEIHVDCSTDCRLESRNALGGFFSDERVLTLGLPLIGGTNIRQLAGLIAHVLCRNAETGPARSGAIIELISAWMRRCAHVPDQWDEQLGALAAQPDPRLRLAAIAARSAAILGRLVMRGPEILVAQISRRAMFERWFNADTVQAQLCGTSDFESTLRRRLELDAAAERAHKRSLQARMGMRLSDNLPATLIDDTRRMGDRLQEDIKAAMEYVSLAPADTAPTVRQRIERVQQDNPEPHIALDIPGDAVLPRYERLCKQATLLHYRNVLKLNVTANELVPVNTRNTARTSTIPEAASGEALKEYTGGTWSPLRVLKLRRQATYTAPDLKETRQRLDDLVQQLRVALPDYTNALREYTAAINAGESGEAVLPRMTRFESLLTQRLELALALRVSTQDQNEISRLTRALHGHTDVADLLRQLRAQMQRAGQSPEASLSTAADLYRGICAKLAGVPDPFAPEGMGRSVGAALQQNCGDADQLGADAAQFVARAGAIVKFVELQLMRVVARLCAFARAAEDDLGVVALHQTRPNSQHTTTNPETPDDKLPF